MPRVEEDISIGAPVEDVFAFMADPVNTQLYPGIVGVHGMTGCGLGRSWRESYRFGGREIPEESTVIEYQPNHRKVLENRGAIESVWLEEYTPTETGTRVHFVVDWRVPGDVRDEETVCTLDEVTRDSVHKYLHNVKYILEGTFPPQA